MCLHVFVVDIETDIVTMMIAVINILMPVAGVIIIIVSVGIAVPVTILFTGIIIIITIASATSYD